MYREWFQCGCRPETCRWDFCGHGPAAPKPRLCNILFSPKDAKMQRRVTKAPTSMFQWFFCASEELVSLELCIQRQVQRTDPAKVDSRDPAQVNDEERYSWMENTATSFKTQRDLVFQNVLTSDEVRLRLIASSEEEEILGEAVVKVDEDIEDTVGLEGEITIPLVRGSRLCGYATLDVQLQCEGGTRPPKKISRAGQGISMAVHGRPKTQLPVPILRRSLERDQEAEEVVRDFSWQSLPTVDTLRNAENSTPSTRVRTPSPQKKGPPEEKTFMAAALPTIMPEEAVEISVPLPDPSRRPHKNFSTLLPGLSEPPLVTRFAMVPHPEEDLMQPENAPPGPRALTGPGASGPPPGPAPGPAASKPHGISKPSGFAGAGPSGPPPGPAPGPAASKPSGLAGLGPSVPAPGPAPGPAASQPGPGPSGPAPGPAASKPSGFGGPSPGPAPGPAASKPSGLAGPGPSGPAPGPAPGPAASKPSGFGGPSPGPAPGPAASKPSGLAGPGPSVPAPGPAPGPAASKPSGFGGPSPGPAPGPAASKPSGLAGRGPSGLAPGPAPGPAASKPSGLGGPSPGPGPVHPKAKTKPGHSPDSGDHVFSSSGARGSGQEGDRPFAHLANDTRHAVTDATNSKR